MADIEHTPDIPESAANELCYSGFAKFDERDFVGAIETLELAIKNRTDYPAPASAYIGVAWFHLKHFQRAIDFLSWAIRLDPRGQALDDSAFYRRWRGYALLERFRYRKALADFRHIADHDTPNDSDLATLGFLSRIQGRYAEALTAFESALNIDRDNYSANHGLAYILATCPNADLRDGARAVQIATRLNEKSLHGNWGDLSLLAAAYAEVGDFDKAVEFARLSAAYAPPGAERERMKRVRLYERKKRLRSRPWLDRYRYRLQMKWLEKQRQSGRGEFTDT